MSSSRFEEYLEKFKQRVESKDACSLQGDGINTVLVVAETPEHKTVSRIIPEASCKFSSNIPAAGLKLSAMGREFYNQFPNDSLIGVYIKLRVISSKIEIAKPESLEDATLVPSIIIEAAGKNGETRSFLIETETQQQKTTRGTSEEVRKATNTLEITGAKAVNGENAPSIGYLARKFIDGYTDQQFVSIVGDDEVD